MNYQNYVFRVYRPVFVLASSALLICGCATPPRAPEVPDGMPWTASRLRLEFCGEDPWEGFNRAMFAVDDTVMHYVAQPVGTVYCSVVPRPLVKGVDNAIDNAEYPIRLAATLCRGEWGASWDETRRFLINTTVGIGGLFDPAEDWFDIPPSDASFSGTLSAWKVDRGPALVLPFVPRGNVRDAAGYAIDKGFDPKTWVGILFPTDVWIPWTASLWPNYAAVWSDPWESTVTPAVDGYSAFTHLVTAKSLLDEDLSLYRYRKQLSAGTSETRRPSVREPLVPPEGLQGRWRDIAGYEPRTPALDTIRQRLFTPRRDNDFWWMRQSVFNRDFAKSVDERRTKETPELPATRYGFVRAGTKDGPMSRVVFVIPGIGGTHASRATLAMGELIQESGCPVILCDDPFHWEYTMTANRGRLPGFLPDDARRFAAFMRAVQADLAEEGFDTGTEVSVVGWSMGGLLTTHLAAIEHREGLGFRTGTLLAVNAPVAFSSIDTALEDFLGPTRNWTRTDARRNFIEIGRRLAVWDASHNELTPDISEDDARFTVATALGTTLPGLVALTTGTNAAVSVHDYFCTYVAAEHPENPIDVLAHQTGLLGLEETLRGNTKLQMIHTRDDFLLTEDDRAFLDRTLGDRITWFSAGAHCGMFFTPEFKDELLSRLGLAQQ